MPKFNVGDKIRALMDHTGHGGYKIVKGQIYTVKALEPTGNPILEDSNDLSWKASRFELVQLASQAPPKTKKKDEKSPYPMFNPGDRVIHVHTPRYTPSRILTLGKTYTVIRSTREGFTVVTDDNGDDTHCYSERFRLANDEPPFKIRDFVIAISTDPTNSYVRKGCVYQVTDYTGNMIKVDGSDPWILANHFVLYYNPLTQEDRELLDQLTEKESIMNPYRVTAFTPPQLDSDGKVTKAEKIYLDNALQFAKATKDIRAKTIKEIVKADPDVDLTTLVLNVAPLDTSIAIV